MNEHVFAWVAAVMMLAGASMLVAGVGAPDFWITVITIGIALVVIERYRDRRARHLS